MTPKPSLYQRLYIETQQKGRDSDLHGQRAELYGKSRNARGKVKLKTDLHLPWTGIRSSFPALNCTVPVSSSMALHVAVSFLSGLVCLSAATYFAMPNPCKPY